MGRYFFLVLLLAGLSACAPFERILLSQERSAARLGAKTGPFRFFADDDPAVLDRAYASVAQAAQGPLDILALSGGGPDGAFGAGVLVGWSETGTCPVFEIVTGVSIGSIVAPYAFLGEAYDEDLSRLIARTGKDFGTPSFGLIQLLRGGGAFSPVDLRGLVRSIVTPRVVDEIAQAQRAGRRLYVVTTHLDAQRLAIWDIGALAQLGVEAAPLIQGIIVASASIPGAFPAVRLEWPGDAEEGFEELHVDGGTIAQIWMPDPRRLRALGAGSGHVYAILNNALEPEYDVVLSDTASVAAASASILFRAGSQAELSLAQAQARAAGYGFQLAYIRPGQPVSESALDFDPERLNEIFEAGRAVAADGSVWTNRVPRIYRDSQD